MTLTIPRRIAATGLAASLMTLAVPVVASDPMGVYCIVDKVVLEPADRAERAQVWGVCAVANEEDWYFQAPAKGYFYYSAPAGRETVARAEWADLKSVAGTSQAVGFGRRYYSVGRFRKDTEKPGTPDPYPIHLGVMKVGSGRTVPEVTEVVTKLRAFRGR